MAVQALKSLAISNADASPRVPNSPYFEGGILRASSAQVQAGAADSNGSTYRMLRLPSNAKIHSLKKFNDANTAGTAYDFGIYDTAANGGAVVADNAFANNLDLSSADKGGTELVFSAQALSSAEKRLWEILGLSADPGKEYDLVITADTAGTAGGYMAVECFYSI